ncbi:MAG TPA: sugar phosphate nucleotidyltransferase [Thermodesulfobacteriota bacterium]|nr:sugar phosphate nucleotidyltransferase [Thermodesulfobacteriota bacterium]
MASVVAFVLAGGRVDELSVLTFDRPKSALPFAGNYRVIDFALSNLMHARINNVGILSQYRSSSLITHIGNGASWDMSGRRRQVALLPPSKGRRESDWYKGSADAVAQNLEFIYENDPDLVLIISGDHIYRMDYQPLIQFHLEKKADLTAGFIKVPKDNAHRFGLGTIKLEKGLPGGPLLDYQEKPAEPQSQWASLTIYLFKTSVLLDMLRKTLSKRELNEFGRDIMPLMVHQVRAFGYCFSGYWGYTRTLDEYWQTHMDLLQSGTKIDLKSWEIRSNLAHERIQDRQPALVGPKARLDQVLLTNGCHVEGRATRSVLFPGVCIEEGAVVEDSILFYDTVVEAGAVVKKTIADKRVRIGEKTQVGGDPQAPGNKTYPQFLSSGLTVIGRNTHLPPNMQVGSNCILFPYLEEDFFRSSLIPSGATLS